MGPSGHTVEEIAARAEALYEQKIRNKVEAGNIGKYLVIDVKTGDYEIDESDIAAMKRAAEKHPGGRFHILRIMLLPSSGAPQSALPSGSRYAGK
ncbi:MAG TPA: hypothetical protein VFB38_25450 [Chthonomonadaceae bacterium]|nr:hypothetical protein [Chthonomonadaceae bacterium]